MDDDETYCIAVCVENVPCFWFPKSKKKRRNKNVLKSYGNWLRQMVKKLKRMKYLWAVCAGSEKKNNNQQLFQLNACVTHIYIKVIACGCDFIVDANKRNTMLALLFYRLWQQK